MDLLRRLQLEESDMLRWFDGLCCKYNIQYFAIYGTALGAVRHGGFIPWDDDIDVGMLRKDFENFKILTKEEFGTDYILIEGGDDCPYHDKVFPRIYKIGTVFHTAEREDFLYNEGTPKCPMWMDIFLYDYIDSESELQEKISFSRRQKRRYLYCKFKYKYSSDNSIKQIIKTFIKRMLHSFYSIITNPNKIFEKYIITVRKDEGKYIATFDAWEIKDMNSSFCCLDELLPVKRMMFEGFEISVPNDVNNILEKCYGNYMELPPIEDRVGHLPKKIVLKNY